LPPVASDLRATPYHDFGQVVYQVLLAEPPCNAEISVASGFTDLAVRSDPAAEPPSRWPVIRRPDLALGGNLWLEVEFVGARAQMVMLLITRCVPHLILEATRMRSAPIFSA
jgi:hypothetical protein